MLLAIEVIDNFQGFRDVGLIDAAIGAARNQEIYGGIHDPIVLSVHLMNNIQRQQALVDGSKRLGMALGFAFLEVNGYPEASAKVDDLAFAEQFLELIAGRITVDELADQLRAALG
jgi:prophage maintenance system killer protein